MLAGEPGQQRVAQQRPAECGILGAAHPAAHVELHQLQTSGGGVHIRPGELGRASRVAPLYRGDLITGDAHGLAEGRDVTAEHPVGETDQRGPQVLEVSV